MPYGILKCYQLQNILLSDRRQITRGYEDVQKRIVTRGYEDCQ